MRFALLGNHPDALDMACALVQSGRHQLAAFTAAAPDDIRQRWGPNAKAVADLEGVLADPAVELVLVAGTLANRAQQLRRALQSERHVLCVYPPDDAPEIAYEAGLIRQDTGYVLLPLLPSLTHPAVARLAQFVRREKDPPLTPTPLPATGERGRGEGVGAFAALEVRATAAGEVLGNVETEAQKPSFPGWEVLRRLGGEVAEVTAFAEREELSPGAPVFVAGRFDRGGPFQLTLLPSRAGDSLCVSVAGARGRAELLLPQGWAGPALLTWRDEAGELHEEAWERWDPWPALVAEFETAVALMRKPPEEQAKARPAVSWQDAVRGLELDDAARRSVERRRSSVLDYQEVSEEVGFKGTMTLVGCLVVWLLPLALWLIKLYPVLVWFLVPVLVIFLGLQLLRYLIPKRPPPAK